MITEEFEKAFNPERPALVIYAMGTTFKGGIDDMKAVNAILEKHPDTAFSVMLTELCSAVICLILNTGI